jgi:2-desacetyl-2-hydroxyethyl bacteriochlorophyllide A dehydrogenase
MPQKPINALETALPAQRRSQGQIVVARSLWYVKPGVAELRAERLAPPRPGEARVATLFSGISRGTECLVANGEVPESEWVRMRAPLQAGAFPYPVKYGYSATGIVTAGPDTLIGKPVFCLHPHQDHFQVAENMLVAIPDGIPAKRATLAANMETALNAHWDAGTLTGDRLLVVGAGVVGLLAAHLARRFAGADVTITDIDAGKAVIATALGLKFAMPSDVPGDNRIVFHTSATGAGLETAINAAAFEGRIVELSWYGARPATVRLGGAFHSRRLRIISSQVGHVAPNMRPTVSHRDRLAKALALLDDARLDALVADEIDFDAAPATLPHIFSGARPGLSPVIRYKKP